MTDQQVCPIDGTQRVGAFRYCRTCNFDFETAPVMPASPPPAPVVPPLKAAPPAQPTAATPEAASRPAAPTPPVTPAAAAPPAAAPPAPARELTAAERWQALTSQVDATQGWVRTPVDQPPAPAPVIPATHDPSLGWDAVAESERLVPREPSPRPFTLDERGALPSGGPEAGQWGSPPGAPSTSGVAPATAPGSAAALATASATATRAVATARVVGSTVAREARRYDHTVATRWPKRRWLIHGATGVAAFLLLAIPLSAAPPPGSDPVPTDAVPTAAPTVAIGNRIRIDEPANGSRHATDRVTFRGIGPVGAAVVQDVPLADDPRTTIGADGTWALDVALGPGENLITLRLGDDRATQVMWTLTSTLPAATATPEPTPKPRPIVPVAGEPAAFKTISLKGSGDAVVTFTIPDDAVAIAGIVHKGKGTFRVTALDADDQQTQVLVDHSGTYRGTSLFDVDLHSATFRIEAGGAWTVTIKPVGGAKLWDQLAPIEGKGSAVMRLAAPVGPSTAANVAHTGSGTFVLIAYRVDGREVLVESSGEYSSAIVVPEGTVLFEIVTLGAWNMSTG